MTKILVTSALPYANGPIHIGHLVEYIQTDIFVRFLKLIGKDVIYCCADDTHGTPIEISAKKQGITPEELIARYHKEHFQDFTDFHIKFDSYYTTNSPENKKFSDLFFERAKKKGVIYQKEVEQLYCKKCKRFLPDRFVRGTCPKCDAPDQYGDVCEKCNSAYKTTDLVNPRCAVCGSEPAIRSSKHYFFKLCAFQDRLEKWLKDTPLQQEIRNFVLNWVKGGLEDWCISRDSPYFGFKIPGEEDKYYYVWLDAPIGYIASTENYCKKHNLDALKDYWGSKDAEIIHFIGKDIVYFHFLFWPALLMAADFRLPSYIVVHGFLTVNKEKMSKSRGTFLTAREFLNAINPEFLRFYYGANLTDAAGDIDLNLEDFKDRINNELVANIGNFIYRTLSFTNSNFDGKITKIIKTDKQFLGRSETGTVSDLKDKKIASGFDFDKIKGSYEKCNFREAVKEILHIGKIANKYFQDNEPWKLVKEDKEEAQEVLTACVNIAKNLAIVLKPVIPEFSANVEKQLKLKDLKWKDLGFNLENYTIGKEEILFRKIDKELDVFKPNLFSKLNLKVAEISDVNDHPEAEKLYVMQINIGKEKRQLVAGIKKWYSKEELKGKRIVVVTNLKPAKLRGFESNGMLLAAEKDGECGLLIAEKSKAGEQVFIEGVEPKTEQIDIKEFSEIEMLTKNGKVVYMGSVLKTKHEDIKAEKVVDGGKIH